MSHDDNELPWSTSAEAAMCLIAFVIRINDNVYVPPYRQFSKRKRPQPDWYVAGPAKGVITKPRKPKSLSKPSSNLDPLGIVGKNIRVIFHIENKFPKYIGNVLSYCNHDGCYSVYFKYDKETLMMNFHNTKKTTYIGPSFWEIM